MTADSPPEDDPFPPQLIAAARDGDGEALRRLHARVEPHVVGVLLTLTRRSDELEDLRTEVCAEVLLGLHRYRGDGTFKAWVAAIAARRLRHRIRNRVREEKMLAEVGAWDQPASHGPDEVLSHREQLLRTAEEMAELPERLYLSLVMVNILGEAPAKAARTIGGTARSIANSAYRARTWIRERLAAREHSSGRQNPDAAHGAADDRSQRPARATGHAGRGGGADHER
ncbi:MAG: sigma-70 family RNA polymerase sigma factor [Deltaproteobacteria bacterium]|nr:sigma-70 family RNA polymerase sigma factor [Deltaproteobacteria bacterium]